MRSTERIQETYLALKISKNWVSSKIMTLLEKKSLHHQYLRHWTRKSLGRIDILCNTN